MPSVPGPDQGQGGAADPLHPQHSFFQGRIGIGLGRPEGRRPVLQYHFNWKSLSAIAGVTWWRFYFRLYPGAIKSPQIVEFLQHLMRHVRGPLLVVWDGLPSYRSGLVRDFVDGANGRLVLERLPAYAPELNPVEYLEAP